MAISVEFMTTIVLFHHVLGLTRGVTALASALREQGMSVVTPDLFDGRTFDELGPGLAHANQLGDEELLRRAEQACAGLPADVVYGGFSLGVLPAQHLLQTRPGAAGGVLLHSFFDPSQLRGSWPQDCPVDVFGMDREPFFVGDGDLDTARSWRRGHDNLHIHLYPGEGHLFMEPSLSDHDEQVARQVTRDLVSVLAAMGRQ